MNDCEHTYAEHIFTNFVSERTYWCPDCGALGISRGQNNPIFSWRLHGNAQDACKHPDEHQERYGRYSFCKVCEKTIQGAGG